ncbi:MAG: hypothetical protein ACT4N4_16305, partial [Rhodospirillales bacterium]
MIPTGGDGDLFLMTAAVFAAVVVLLAALLLAFAGEGSVRARKLGRRVEEPRRRGGASGRSPAPASASSSIKLAQS